MGWQTVYVTSTPTEAADELEALALVAHLFAGPLHDGYGSSSSLDAANPSRFARTPCSGLAFA